MNLNLHHLHKRKRSSGHAHHPYPANSAGLRLLDKVVYVAGIVSLTMMLPQLRLIYVGKEAGGLEPITWFTLAVLDIPWIFYGLVHKEAPLTFIYTGWLVVNALIFIGAVIY